jgi:glycosyltransferase involved in cell wall biosynthesis
MKRKQVCLIATIPFAIKVFMAPHVKKLSTVYDVTLMANGKEEDLAELLNEHVRFISVPIERHISISKDLKALFFLFKLFVKYRFSSIHSITPKAGLLAMTAGRLALTPVRIHTFTGQVWATTTGRLRSILMFMDKVMAFNATNVFSDSPSQSTFLIEHGIVKKDEISILADGSFNGVDINRFRPDKIMRAKVRQELHINEDVVLFLYMGRLHIEKGLLDLFKAFSIAAKNNSKLELLIVGPNEGEFDEKISTLEVEFPNRIHRVGYTKTPEIYIATADVFCLPSYREGFGSVLIEAASSEVPSIASRIYGITDAVEDGVTGILHTPKAENEIADAMILLATNEELRIKMGKNARERATKVFSEERVTNAFLSFYKTQIHS